MMDCRCDTVTRHEREPRDDGFVGYYWTCASCGRGFDPTSEWAQRIQVSDVRARIAPMILAGIVSAHPGKHDPDGFVARAIENTDVLIKALASWDGHDPAK